MVRDFIKSFFIIEKDRVSLVIAVEIRMKAVKENS